MWADAQPNVMVAQPNIDGTLCESSVIPLTVPRQKLWLTAAAQVSCSNAANIEEHKTWTQSEYCTWQNSIRGQDPPKMYIYSVPAQEMVKHHAKFGWPPVSDVAAVTKPIMRNPLKFAGVPQTGKPISAISGLTFAIL